MTKHFFTLSVLLNSVTIVLAQQVVKSHNFSNTSLVNLMEHPFENDELLGVQLHEQPDGSMHKKLLNITANSSSALLPIGVDYIVDVLGSHSDNLILNAHSNIFGLEPVLVDSSGNTILFDLNSGAPSSLPTAVKINDRFFFIASWSNNHRQLFELLSDGTLQQFTMMTTHDVHQIHALQDGKLYYSTHPFDVNLGTYTGSGSIEFRQLDLTNGQTVVIGQHEGTQVWNTLFHDGHLYYQVIHDYVSPDMQTNYITDKLFRVENNLSPTLIVNDSVYNDFTFYHEYFSYQNALYKMPRLSTGTLSKSTDGVTFSTALTLANGESFQDLVVRDNSCSFIIQNANDQNNVRDMNNDLLTQICSADYHIRYLSEKDNFRYYLKIGSPTVINPMAYLIEQNLDNNSTQEFLITDDMLEPGGISIAKRTHIAEWIGNALYFIFGDDSPPLGSSFDIYRYERSLGMNKVEADAHDLSLYPNPSNGNIRLSSGKTGLEKAIVYTESGREIQTIEIGGGNTASFDLSSGFYILMVSYLDGTVQSKKVTVL